MSFDKNLKIKKEIETTKVNLMTFSPTMEMNSFTKVSQSVYKKRNTIANRS